MGCLCSNELKAETKESKAKVEEMRAEMTEMRAEIRAEIRAALQASQVPVQAAAGRRLSPAGSPGEILAEWL